MPILRDIEQRLAGGAGAVLAEAISKIAKPHMASHDYGFKLIMTESEMPEESVAGTGDNPAEDRPGQTPAPESQAQVDEAETGSTEEVPAIEVTGLTKRYGRITAIEKVSFRVAKGEVVGFLGPNGAGKSTTMRILTGLLMADAGSASLCGIPVAEDPARVQSRIGFMPEQNPLPDDLRVGEYLHYRGRLKGLRGKRLRTRVEAVMEICDLGRKARRKLIGALSKGFRQRVGIADALIAEPEVIIMDEPTIGLDPHQIRAIRELIRSLRGKMTVLLSSHILPEIEACCDKVIIINHGQVVAHGSPACLREAFIPFNRLRLQVNGSPQIVERLVLDTLAEARIDSIGGADAQGYREYLLETPPCAEAGSQLLHALQQAHLQVRELAILQPDLEDVFLAATKRSWQVTEASLATPH